MHSKILIFVGVEGGMNYFHLLVLNALLNLDLNNCSKLHKSHTSIGQLSAFQNLNLDNCSSLQELFTSISELNAFQKP